MWLEKKRISPLSHSVFLMKQDNHLDTEFPSRHRAHHPRQESSGPHVWSRGSMMLKHRVLGDQPGSQTAISSGPADAMTGGLSFIFHNLNFVSLKTQREKGVWRMRPLLGQTGVSDRKVEKWRKGLWIWNSRNHGRVWGKVTVWWWSLPFRPGIVETV